MWSVPSTTTPPPSVEAVYFLWLPEEQVVLWAHYSDDINPSEYQGNIGLFKGTLATNTPMIPMDSHHALSLNWLDINRMTRNRPYLDEAIRAAIALVA